MESPQSDINSPQYPTEEGQKSRLTWIKTIAKWVLASILLLVIASFSIAYVFEDKIKARLIEEINGQLKTALSVESFQLSLLKGFPYVSADFSKVILEDTFQNTAPFIEASSVSFKLSVLELIRGEVNVKSVLIKDGALVIYVNSKGKPNYKVFKTSDNKEGGSNDFQLGIEEAILENIEIIYTNKNTDITSKMRIEKATLSGDFNSDLYALQSKGIAESHFIDVEDHRFIAGNQLDFDFILDIDMNQNLYTFDKGNLVIDDNVYDITGKITADPSGFIYDLKANSKKGNLASALTLLPTEYIESFRGITSTGTFLFDFTYKGQKTRKQNPALKANLRLKNGQIKSPHFEAPLKNVSLSASFTNGKSRNLKSSVLHISDFKGYFNKALTQMELRVSNMEDPLVDLELDGTIPVKSLYKFFKQDYITEAKGTLEINKLKVNGKQKYMRSMSNISKVKVSGEIAFDNAGLSINKFPFLVDRGALVLKGNNIDVNNLHIVGADSDALFSGNFQNLIPVMFADSTNSQNAILKFKSKLSSKSLDLDQLVSAFTSAQSEGDGQDNKEASGWHSKISGFLDGEFQADIASLHYNDLKGTEFEGSVDFEDDILTIDGDIEAMDGSMSIEGELFLLNRPKLIGQIEGKKIDVHKFFKQTHNFGQDVIIADNLKGRMNTNMLIKAYFDEQGTFLSDKLKVYAGLEIHNGELLDLEVLNSFSTFINHKDLEHIKFTKLENWFEISNGKVHIPVMFIQSNAANLTVSGTHSFDHDIDYNIKVNAAQVFMSKIKKHNRNLKPQRDQRNGKLNLFYTIKGNTDEYVIKNNRKAVLKDFKRSTIKKDHIRKILEDSFGEFDLNENYARVEKEATPESKPTKPATKSDLKSQPEVIQAALDEGIPEFEVEEDNLEYIEFQGDDGD